MNGVEVVVGDLTRGPDVIAALDGCRRLYFRMSVSPDFLEAAATVAAAALESRQQRLHWLAEQV
jgi:hypothetical protein